MLRTAAALALSLTAIASAQSTAAGSTSWSDAVPIRSIDPDDDDFRDLQPLKRFFRNARIVQLGEESHGDGAAFYAKQRLIRFLHAEMGFNVLAWESGFFDCEEMEKALHTDMPIPQARAVGLFSIWANGPFVAPVLEYARSTHKTARPLRMTGFDIQYSGTDTRRVIAERALSFLAGFRPDLATPKNRSAVADLVSGNFITNEDERQIRLDVLDRILRSFGRSDKLSREQKFYRKVFENIAAFDQQRWMSPVMPPSFEAENYRDQKMGEHLVWLANEWYPNEKIIVWAANVHVLHNAAQIDTITPSVSFKERVTMGDVVHQKLGKEVYTVGFTAYGGEVGNPFQPKPRTLPAPPADSIEAQLHALGHAHLFVDLSRLPASHVVRKPMFAWPLGYVPMKAVWANTVDALFFTDAMFPNTKGAKLPEGVQTRRRP